MVKPIELTDFSGLDPIFLVAPQRVKLPADIFEELKAHVHTECNNSARSSYDHKLAGNIWNGEQIEATTSLPLMIQALLCVMGRKYVFRMAKLNAGDVNPDLKVSFIDSWIVKSKEGDYNPVHMHGGNLSGIIYLEVPPQVADPMQPDGKLDFIFGQFKPENLDFLGSRQVVPSVGDLYLFPAWLQHVVYPFRGAGERISYSFNLNVKDVRFDAKAPPQE